MDASSGAGLNTHTRGRIFVSLSDQVTEPKSTEVGTVQGVLGHKNQDTTPTLLYSPILEQK